MNITLIGMPGSGKSYFGKKLADKLGYSLIELDLVTEQKYNLPLQKVLDNIGEEKFLKEQGDDAVVHSKNKSNVVISPGGSIVYTEFAMAHLKSVSKIIYLKTNFETIEKRVGKKPRGIIGLKEKTLKELYDERVRLYEKWADHFVDAEQGESEIMDLILKNL
jgi:shikimate kinase